VRTRLKQTILGLAALGLALVPVLLGAQSPAAPEGPPASTGGIFPLDRVHSGLTGTAWTVFSGSKPEAMEVEILGVLRGARGPGQDMILARLHGAHPEYTGVVEGMSGSPVYIGDKLVGALAYRIGQFSKEPIAGITPIEQMLLVRDLPIEKSSDIAGASEPIAAQAVESPGRESFRAMETPLVMSGFRPEAVQMWQQKMAGTSLESVAAGGMGGSSQPGTEPSAAAQATLVPGSAVSALLVRGDLEISATCTVTYIDPRQLLACGHPILQSGPVSLPMTTADVVATLASPLNAFKIINTGATVGAFTEDRSSAIRGVLGANARMIPMHVTIDGPGSKRKLNAEILDLPSLTPQAMMVVLYNSLLDSNDNTAGTSYHLTGSIELAGYPLSTIDLWAAPSEAMPAPIAAAVFASERFTRLYSNGARQGSVRSIDIHVETVPHRVQVALETARLVSGNVVHAGDTIVVEATIRPWQQAARNVRISVALPARLGPGNLRLLVSDAGTLDRAMDQQRFSGRPADLEAVLAQDRRMHPSNYLYVSILAPESQAVIAGQTLSNLPLSVANAMEPLRPAQDVNLNGESAVVAAQVPAGGVLSGFQVLNIRIEPGSGLN